MSDTFRLAVVLRLRELAEDAARAKLGAALARHRRSMEILDERRGLAASARAGAAALTLEPEPPAAAAFVAAQVTIDRADASVAAGTADAERAAQALLEARTALADASRRREVVERLRDRLRAAQAAASMRRLDAELNEIASVRHARTVIEQLER